MYTTLEQVKIRLGQFHIEQSEDGSDKVVFDHPEENPLIEQLIEQGTQDVISKRIYPESYTQEQIDNDLKKLNSVIVNLAVYDYSQAGESYMKSYSENGISRNWKDRDDLFIGVYPFVKML